MTPLFGRRDDGPRTAADREAARLERERRRAEREGRPPPEEPAGDGREDAPAPFEWDAPGDGALDPNVSAPRAWDPEHHEPPEPRVRGAGDAGGDPERLDAEPERFEPDSERFDPEPYDELPPEPERFEAEPSDDRPPEREPFDDRDPDRAPAPWRRPHAVNARGDAHAVDANGAADSGASEGGGAGDPQATQPFDPVAPDAPSRRTVSLPRPQTDTSEWDAPIGTVRVSRRGGGGGSGPRPYQAQPGAPGYPPYRKLAVKPRRRWLRRIVAVLALGVAIAAAAFAFLLFQPFHGDGSGRVEVVVPAGSTADQIGDMLAARGVVRSGRLFAIRARISGQRGKLRSGRYVLKKGMSYGAALTALTTAPKAAPVVNVTVPEGPSRREEAPKLEAAGLKGDYLAATRRSSRLDPRDYGAPRSTRSLEGFLYPATYELRQSQATARRLVNRQLDAFRSNFAKVDMRQARRRNLSRYDVLIIASMIEREALVARDRRLISAVIYNRLKEGIPLGIDATLRYALNQWSRPLRVSELNSNSAFNTRKHRGLPPTPIGNPGLAAMKAAANPAHASYLFYVVKPCGNGAHAFSSTDAKFQQDVARYNKARAKRGGKDPSRC